MRVHYIQHVPFEKLGVFETYFINKGYEVTFTKQCLGRELPALDAFDLLVVLGGPMGVGDTKKYPWLEAEKAFIKEAIDAGKKVLGVCLGAQLMAQALGAKISKNEEKEIGWFEITPEESLKETILKDVLDEPVEVFHWHGDRFEIPSGATPIAKSEACETQGFIIEDRVIGLQFHLETTYMSAKELINNALGDMVSAEKFIQSEEEMLHDLRRFDKLNEKAFSLLDALLLEE